MKKAWTHFTLGLLTPHPFVMVCGAILALLVPVFLQSFFQCGHIAHFELRHLLRDNHDDFLYNTWQLSRLRHADQKEIPVYLLGGSAMRESFVSPASFTRAIKEHSGQHANVHLLATPFRSFATCLTVIENLPDGPGIVLLGINSSRFHYGLNDYAQDLSGQKIILNAKQLYSFKTTITPTIEAPVSDPSTIPPIFKKIYGKCIILPGIMSYFADYFTIHKPTFLRGKMPSLAYSQHRYSAQERRSSPAKKKEHLRKWQKIGFKLFHENYELNFKLLNFLLNVAKDKGLTVVMHELAVDTEFLGTSMDEIFELYRPRLHVIAQKYDGVSYVNFTDKLNYTSHDFGDLSHLSFDSSRGQYEEQLAMAIRPIIYTMVQGDSSHGGL